MMGWVMNVPGEFLGVAPWVIIATVVTWAVTAIAHREKKKINATEHAERLEVHRDGLALTLIQNARNEMSAARVEVEDLRDEVRKLRAMETHFYHFQQSLDHLEALLFPETVEDGKHAERNARAFLTRMRRLNEAKGTLANEAQRAASEISVKDDLGRDMGNAG
jgi:polyhydroxyalkanoate synthesis regulator phasin